VPIVLTSNDAVAKLIAEMRARARKLGPWSERVREYLLRQTQRKAPRRRGALGKSLNAERSTETSIVISSPLPYAGIQAKGGTITAGSGPLKSKYLAIPLNEEARRMVGRMGTHQSLRDKKLVLIRTKKGTLLLARLKKRRKLRLTKEERRLKRKLGIKRLKAEPPEYMFVLKESVSLEANPPPSGYAPTLADPATRAWITKSGERYVLKGEA
jgi:hypothetical protein